MKAEVHLWHEEWHKRVRSLNAELAANGIVGGPTVNILIELARTEVRTRVQGITAAIIRACDDLDVPPSRMLEPRLNERVEQIATPILTLVQTNPEVTMLLRAQPNREDGERAFAANVDSAVKVALSAANTEIPPLRRTSLFQAPPLWMELVLEDSNSACRRCHWGRHH